MRRALGGVLALSGAVLLLVVGVAYARGALARDRARAEWSASDARDAVLAIDRHVGASAVREPLAAGAPMARLIIPVIHLDEVVVEGVEDAQLAAGPGHLPASAFPGDSGNAVISAHRDRHFHGLDELSLGDTVITETVAGRTTWVVVGRRVVERGKPALFPTETPTLTLTTCWPVRYIGPAPDRLLITARPVPSARRI
ncbi:MAG TPA: sortase [Gemmatimonadaceae bacterium]